MGQKGAKRCLMEATSVRALSNSFLFLSNILFIEFLIRISHKIMAPRKNSELTLNYDGLLTRSCEGLHPQFSAFILKVP